MKLYIAGPMRGIPDANFPAFDAARDFLRSIGHEPISPADHDRELGIPALDAESWKGVFTEEMFHTVMAWDLKQVIDADGIALLPGWERSTGAGHERYVAEACGKRIFHLEGTDEVITVNRKIAPTEWRPLRLVEELPATIIGLSGYARAGKDTVGAMLVEHHGFERLAFADALKQVLYDTDPWMHGPTDGRGKHDAPWVWSVQEAIHTHGWDWAKDNTEARTFLQRLGQSVREHVAEDAWLQAALRKVQPGGRYVITDVRYRNEAQAIVNAGGQVWRIDRPGTGPANDHPSETDLDRWPFDGFVLNHWDLAYLEQVVSDTFGAPQAA